MKTVKVYRNGSLTPATYAGEVAQYADRADAAKPAGRAGRNGSLYAVSTLNGVSRWVRASILCNTHEDLNTYEITINPEKTYVYYVQDWEAVSSSFRPLDPAKYWEQGMLLSEYLELATDEEDDKWEILINPEDVISARRVSKKRLLANIKDSFWREQTESAMNRVRL